MAFRVPFIDLNTSATMLAHPFLRIRLLHLEIDFGNGCRVSGSALDFPANIQFKGAGPGQRFCRD